MTAPEAPGTPQNAPGYHRAVETLREALADIWGRIRVLWSLVRERLGV